MSRSWRSGVGTRARSANDEGELALSALGEPTIGQLREAAASGGRAHVAPADGGRARGVRDALTLGLSSARWDEDYELHEGLRFVDQLTFSQRLAYRHRGAIVLRGAGEPRELSCGDRLGAGYELVWSHDGRTLYDVREQIRAIDVASGRAREVTRFQEDEGLGPPRDLSLTPDDRTLYFQKSRLDANDPKGRRRHICAIDTDGTNARVVYDPPPEHGRLWTFDGDFAGGKIRAALLDRRQKPIYEMDLDGGNVGLIASPALGNYLDPSIERFRLWHDDGLVPSVDHAPSRSADGTIAFMRDDHALWLLRRGDQSHCVVRARAGTEPSPSRWAMTPAWSPDGQLLCFSSTTAKRWPEPRNPAFLAELAERYGDRSERYRHSVEHNHWTYEHHAGIVDWDAGAVWMTDGHWRGAAWSRV